MYELVGMLSPRSNQIQLTFVAIKYIIDIIAVVFAVAIYYHLQMNYAKCI